MDFHRFGDIRGADAGLRLDPLHRLVSAGAAAAFAAAARGRGLAAGGSRFVGAAFGATGAATTGATGAAAGGFATELLKGFLSLTQLLTKLANRPLEGFACLVENISGGHLVPFHPKFGISRGMESLPEKHTL